MIDVTTEISINRSLVEVAEFAVNPDNAPQWYQNIKSVKWKTPKPLDIGSEVAFTAHFLGMKLAYTYEVAEFTPEKLVMRTAEGPFPMETIYEFRQRGAQNTLMILRNLGIPIGFSRLVAPFLAMMIRRANSKDLKRLKAILEK